MTEEVEESGSSSDSTEDEVSPSSETAAPSSSADEVESEGSLEDVVRNAYEAKESDEDTLDSSPGEESNQEDTQVSSSESSVDDLPADDEERYKGEPFSKHPRFRELVAEKNRYRTDAEQFDRIKDFMSSNNLSSEDTVEGFRVMALMKNNPQEAYRALYEKMGALGEASGFKIPKDIKQKVDEGYLDEASAQELSRTRAELTRERGIRQQQEQTIQTEDRKASFSKIETSVTDWEATIRQSDPDYDLKAAELDDRVKVLVGERGKPNTSSDALALVREAYDSVNERYRQRTPTKTAIRTATGGKLGGTPSPAPKSLREAIELAIGS